MQDKITLPAWIKTFRTKTIDTPCVWLVIYPCMERVTIIGGGLAGCEAAWAVRRLGGDVTLYEMKPLKFSPAHRLPGLAELVCSNSLKSEDLENASGLLKEEMRLLGSIVMETAGKTRVPAGKALAVDRVRFSELITQMLENAGVRIIRQECSSIPTDRPLIIATGPLTSESFASSLEVLLGRSNLYFYDAIAPIIYRDSIDFSKAFRASRYQRGGDDYINCPMNREEYERFVKELVSARKTPLREFEHIPFFEGCMPIEELARRGKDTLAFGPLRPVGLKDPRTGKTPYAVVQLRRENREDTLYNMVGFQTRLTYGEQKRVFSLIPGLENARFARYGSIHRNSYINSPVLLLPTLQLKKDPLILFAGQLTGVEGYCESAVTGIIAGINAWRLCVGLEPVFPPPTTMAGALLDYITSPERKDFQPMNANFGILKKEGGLSRKECARRALEETKLWIEKILATPPGI